MKKLFNHIGWLLSRAHASVGSYFSAIHLRKCGSGSFRCRVSSLFLASTDVLCGNTDLSAEFRVQPVFGDAMHQLTSLCKPSSFFQFHSLSFLNSIRTRDGRFCSIVSERSAREAQVNEEYSLCTSQVAYAEDSHRPDFCKDGQSVSRLLWEAILYLSPVHKKNGEPVQFCSILKSVHSHSFAASLNELCSHFQGLLASCRSVLLASFFAMACLILPAISAAQTTTVTGNLKDLSGAAITQGQVSFVLQPGIDTTMSGIARFSPTEVDCSITGTGAVKALDGVSSCVITQNTTLSPSGTAYRVCLQPGFIQPGSCFVFYAVTSTVDITTVAPTPAQMPAYHLIDDFSNQTIGGVKTFSSAIGAPNLAGTGSCSNSFVTVINNGGATPTCGATANNVIANQGTNGADALSGSRATDSSPSGNFINFKSFAGATLFKVDITGNATSASLTTATITQQASTQFCIKDNQGGNRFCIPSGGILQATMNNTAIGGGSTYNGTTQNVQKFTSNGTQTIPAGVTSEKVTVCAAGGGGGGSTTTNNGGGGGSASCAIKWLTGLTPGNTLAVIVGTGGAGGLTNATGGTGGASSVSSGTQTITSILTNGGAGGNGSLASSPGGAGGAASSGGDLNLDGTAGSLGFGTNNLGGNGAGSIFGGGAPSSGGAGVNGGAFGAGGGGAGGAAAHSGGAGSAGVVVFEWTN